MDSKEASDALSRLLKESVGSCPPVRNRNGKQSFPGLVPVPRQLSGLGFFPGGDGLWKAPGKSEPTNRKPKPIMIVGSTFGSLAELGSIPFEEDRLDSRKTWAPLLALLRTAGIAPDRCFFTNAYPGVLAGAGNIVTLHPAKLDARYMKETRGFFQEQLKLMQPRLVIFLGLLGPFVLGEHILEQCGWAQMLHPSEGKIRSITKVDESGKSICPEVRITGLPHLVTLALLLHPCHRAPNLKLRRLGADLDPRDPEPQFLNTLAQPVLGPGPAIG